MHEQISWNYIVIKFNFIWWLIKYGIEKSYYRHETGKCEEMVACLSDLYYNPVLNLCEDNLTAKPQNAYLKSNMQVTVSHLKQ